MSPTPSARSRSHPPARWSVRVSRTGRRSERSWRWSAWVVIGTVLSTLCATTGVSWADTSGGSTGTVDVAVSTIPVRSVAVTPPSFTYGNCTGGDPTHLSFGDNDCTSPAISIVNGAAASTLSISSTDLSDGAGGTWTLCTGDLPPAPRACDGPDGGGFLFPGTDQVALLASHTGGGVGGITPTPQVETSLSAGQTLVDTIKLFAPSDSRLTSTQLTHTITWTVGP